MDGVPSEDHCAKRGKRKNEMRQSKRRERYSASSTKAVWSSRQRHTSVAVVEGVEGGHL